MYDNFSKYDNKNGPILYLSYTLVKLSHTLFLVITL
jgi:hypothetical protein